MKPLKRVNFHSRKYTSFELDKYITIGKRQ